MKSVINNILFVAAILIGFQAEALSQTTHYHYRFSYDSSGNREKRIFIGTVLKNASIESSTTFNEEKPLIDNAGFGDIKIYPNPTKGNLVVEIPDLDLKTVRIMVFNLQGKQLVIKNISPNSRTLLNMQNLSSGMYVLKIIAEQKSSEWKIIKE